MINSALHYKSKCVIFVYLNDYTLGFAVWSHANGKTEKLTFPREWTIYYRIYDYFFSLEQHAYI